eukprot:m.60772 g.60772  ORF g.60772 m.60772 type:complete len:52 (-) comp13858_c0_seq2:1188-1343(-)
MTSHTTALFSNAVNFKILFLRRLTKPITEALLELPPENHHVVISYLDQQTG